MPMEYSLGISYRLGWQSIQYCLGGAFRLAGSTQNINWVYLSVRLTVHPILSGWYCRISRIYTEYSLCVSIGLADGPSNIVRVILSDQTDTHRICIGCIYWLRRQPIQYCLDGTVGRVIGVTYSPSNIVWVVLSDRLDTCGIYSLSLSIHQSDSDRWFNAVLLE